MCIGRKSPNIFYFGCHKKVVKEGGDSRNYAFYSAFYKYAIRYNIYTPSPFLAIVNIILFLFLVPFKTNRIIFFHKNSLWYLFRFAFLKHNIYRHFIIRVLCYISERNTLIIEVNDLSYEQAQDLELLFDELHNIVENDWYTVKNAHYIFASNNMMNYAQKKYSLSSDRISVVLNGGLCGGVESPNFKFVRSCTNRITFVYAGSLNKGRQIEELLSIFSMIPKVDLILLGGWGEWISDLDIADNIKYLGNFEESIAHQIVSQCDIGIIPYDETKFYYNLCYPTKASFYITAGIPFLSTVLDELFSEFSQSDTAWFTPVDNWKSLICSLQLSDIKKKNQNVSEIKNMYLWHHLILNNKLLAQVVFRNDAQN